jgi:hypothetical protein
MCDEPVLGAPGSAVRQPDAFPTESPALRWPESLRAHDSGGIPVTTRRSFLASVAGAGLGAALPGSVGAAAGPDPFAWLEPARLPGLLNAFHDAPSDAGAAARDEDLWREVQQAFRVDRTLVNLNNGGVSPAPGVVQDAMARYLAYANEAPVQTMWRTLEPQKEGVRARLARHFGCDTEEMAITRNASEGLQICQFGFDLEAGDEVLDHGPGLPPHAHHLRAAGPARGDPPRHLSPSRCPPRIRRDRAALRGAHHRPHAPHPRVAHREHHRADPAGARRWWRWGGAGASPSSWTAPTPSPTSPIRWRTWDATTTPPRSTSGSSPPSAPASSS